MKLHDDSHLTYCTNVHAGESWPETFASLRHYLPAVKARVAPDRPFGVGLRLSAQAAAELAQIPVLEEFRGFLASGGFYIVTINGFPYGRFHGARLKERVYLPDWQDDARGSYTDCLARILAALLPDGGGASISTVPGGFKPTGGGHGALQSMQREVAGNLLRQAVRLADLEEQSGRSICLALEPEPCCLLETVEETVRYFEQHLFSRAAVGQVMALSHRSAAASEQLLRRHLGVCFDVCHAAVEYEDVDALDRLLAAGIAVPKLQLSAALAIPQADAGTPQRLAPFDDGVYLHQVVERRADGRLLRFTDIAEAAAALDAAPAAEDGREWRVHFHVPLFRRQVGSFDTTQDYLSAVLARQRRSAVATQLEVETYTWGVLPADERQPDLADDIARELTWVTHALAA